MYNCSVNHNEWNSGLRNNGACFIDICRLIIVVWIYREVARGSHVKDPSKHLQSNTKAFSESVKLEKGIFKDIIYKRFWTT